MEIRKQETRLVVIHCSATGPSVDWGVADIDTAHKARGFSSIGYHLVIRRNGNVEAGRHLYEVGAHSTGNNRDSVAVCMVGGVSSNGKSENNFTKEQWASLNTTLAFLKAMFPKASIVGHRDLSPDTNNDGVIDRSEWMKDCPCFSVTDYVNSGFSPQVGLGIGKVKKI